MILRRTRRGILVLSVLTAFSFWLGRDTVERDQQPIRGLDTRLDYALLQFEARYFDADGNLSVHLTAPALTNDAESGVGAIRQPRFHVIENGYRWNIRSESATVAADRETIELEGQVSMRGDAPEQQLSIDTDHVTIEVTPKIAYSDEPVFIRDGANELEAIGFRVNMKNNQFHLEKQVKGRYVID